MGFYYLFNRRIVSITLALSLLFPSGPPVSASLFRANSLPKFAEQALAEVPFSIKSYLSKFRYFSLWWPAEAIRTQVVTAPEDVQFFGANAEKLLMMQLATVADKPEILWPAALKPLYQKGVRVTFDLDTFDTGKILAGHTKEIWFYFVKPKISGAEHGKKPQDQEVKNICDLLKQNGIGGSIAANLRMSFHRQQDGSYNALDHGHGARVIGESSEKILSRIMASYKSRGHELPQKITLQVMNHMFTLYRHGETPYDYVHQALIMRASGDEEVIAISREVFEKWVEFEDFKPSDLEITNGIFHPRTDNSLKDLEAVIHEFTHAVAPKRVREMEFSTVAHSFVNVVEAAVKKAKQPAEFPVAYVWAVFHALNHSRKRDILSHLADYLENFFGRSITDKTDLYRLRELVSLFASKHPEWLVERTAAKMTNILGELGIHFSDPRSVSHEILQQASVRFSGGDDSVDNGSGKLGMSAVVLPDFTGPSSSVFKVGDLVRHLKDHYELLKKVEKEEKEKKGEKWVEWDVIFHVEINDKYQLRTDFLELSEEIISDIDRSMAVVKKRTSESPTVEVIWTIQKSRVRIKVRQGLSDGKEYYTKVPIVSESIGLLGRSYSVETLVVIVSGIFMLIAWVIAPGSPLAWAVSWIGWAGLAGWALFRAIPPRKPGKRPYSLSEKLLLGLLGVHFTLGGFAVYHFSNALIALKPWFEGVSDMVLGFDGAVIGGIIAQWYKTRTPKHKQRKFKMQDMMELIILSVALALLMDGYIYGHLLPILAAHIGIVPAVILDLLFISLFFADPSAMFFYSRFLQNKPRRNSFDEIRSGDLLSFYLQTWWIWGLTMVVALCLAPVSQVASFGVAVSGLLIWNLYFEAETAPSLEERFEGWRKNAPLKYKYFVPPLRTIRWVHASPGYALFLVTSFFSVILGATSYYLGLLHWGVPWNWMGQSFVSSLAILGIWGGDIRERLGPLMKRGLSVGAAIALAAVGLGLVDLMGPLHVPREYAPLIGAIVLPFHMVLTLGPGWLGLGGFLLTALTLGPLVVASDGKKNDPQLLKRFTSNMDLRALPGLNREDIDVLESIEPSKFPFDNWEEVAEAVSEIITNGSKANEILRHLKAALQQLNKQTPGKVAVPVDTVGSDLEASLPPHLARGEKVWVVGQGWAFVVGYKRATEVNQGNRIRITLKTEAGDLPLNLEEGDPRLMANPPAMVSQPTVVIKKVTRVLKPDPSPTRSRVHDPYEIQQELIAFIHVHGEEIVDRLLRSKVLSKINILEFTTKVEALTDRQIGALVRAMMYITEGPSWFKKHQNRLRAIRKNRAAA